LFVFVFKTDLRKHAPGKQPHGRYGEHLGPICGLWAHVRHLYCAQKPRNRSSGEANTQNQQNPPFINQTVAKES
jgi:hypothetical protein